MNNMDIKDLLIEENNTILFAMEKLDKNAKKILFVQKGNQLVASLTDGDIRRWILAQGSLKAFVKEAANYKPKYLFAAEKSKAKKYMVQQKIEALPILDDNLHILNVLFWNDEEISHCQEPLDLPVVIMAGGLGTRLYPYTKILPKPLIPIGDIPIAERIIQQFCKQGCNNFYLIVNHKRNMIKAYFNEIQKEYNLCFIDEDIPLGTGGGLSLLKGQIHSSFILSNCDILIDADMSKIYKLHKQKQNLVTMVCSLKNFSIPYGVVNIGKEGQIISLQEKPSLSFFTNTGCYFVEPEVLDHIEAGTELGFPDIIEQLMREGKNVGVYPIGEKAWLDTGQLSELDKMQKTFDMDAEGE